MRTKYHFSSTLPGVNLPMKLPPGLLILLLVPTFVFGESPQDKSRIQMMEKKGWVVVDSELAMVMTRVFMDDSENRKIEISALCKKLGIEPARITLYDDNGIPSSTQKVSIKCVHDYQINKASNRSYWVTQAVDFYSRSASYCFEFVR